MDQINKDAFHDPSSSPFVQTAVLTDMIKSIHAKIVVSIVINWT